jgi:hypothetical protein
MDNVDDPRPLATPGEAADLLKSICGYEVPQSEIDRLRVEASAL